MRACVDTIWLGGINAEHWLLRVLNPRHLSVAIVRTHGTLTSCAGVLFVNRKVHYETMEARTIYVKVVCAFVASARSVPVC